MLGETELPLQEVTIPEEPSVDPIIVTFDEKTLERTLGELRKNPPPRSAPN